MKYRAMFGNPVELNQFIKEFYKVNNTYSRRDMDLLLYIWERYGLNLDAEQMEVFRTQCPTPETIFRLKRKMREQGEI